MKRKLFWMMLAAAPVLLPAQEKRWSMEDCLRYAVENSTAVRKQLRTNDSYAADKAGATAAFFPSLTTSVSAQYNFGRAVDPGTNTYINTTTFNNYYEVDASIPIFKGGQLVNQFKLAKANRQMGMNDLQKAKDDLALNTLEAYVNVAYYQEAARFAADKLKESRRVLYQTQREEELGQKGKADVALLEAQVAADDYGLTNQQNLFETALLKLKDLMNYPYADTLVIDTGVPASAKDYLPEPESVPDIFAYAEQANPTARQAAFQLKASQLNLLIAKGKWFPSISLSGGIYTSYYEDLKSGISPTAFRSQFRNNQGKYISINFSFPLFDRLQTATAVRKAHNNLRIAQEEQSEVLRQLETAIRQSVLDRDGYAKESIQMEKKLRSDSIAYRLTLLKFEEGLSSPLDLKQSANTLIESKANLLQKQLMYFLKSKQVDYYKGQALY
ncbi:MAG: TolC family protein [Tannerella sp.]|nr:TolC family protein [Tannerella sp.]